MSTCKQCGSSAINHHCHGRDGSDPDLCDVCYWYKRAEMAVAALQDIVAYYPNSWAADRANEVISKATVVVTL